MKRCLFVISLALLLFPSVSKTQEFDAQVKIDMQQLSSEVRDNLSDFVQQTTKYINDYKWTEENFGNDKIVCTFEIHFTSSQGSNHYIAQVFIGSTRPIHKLNKSTAVLRLKDENWEFDYTRFQALQHGNFQFNPLVSFFDFYCNIILGYDFDTWGIEEGTKYFEKAMDIINNARSAGTTGTGWEIGSENTYSRARLVDELLNTQFRSFREAAHRYHYRGLDLLFRKPEQGKKNILAALESIGNLQQKINQPSLIIKTFFETKYLEIADTFRGYADPDVFQKLEKIDPPHVQAYEKARLGQR